MHCIRIVLRHHGGRLHDRIISGGKNISRIPEHRSLSEAPTTTTSSIIIIISHIIITIVVIVTTIIIILGNLLSRLVFCAFLFKYIDIA